MNTYIPTRTNKERYVDNIDKISEYNKNYKTANVESVKLLKQKYYDTNKEALLTKNICICGGSYKTMNRTHHTKTKMHVKFLATVAVQDN